uniref:Orphan protein n=1 Tax=Ascaris lumbricoides TaxID=6252 RepID=A0A0M3HLY3_ASCLU
MQLLVANASNFFNHAKFMQVILCSYSYLKVIFFSASLTRDCHSC